MHPEQSKLLWYLGQLGSSAFDFLRDQQLIAITSFFFSAVALPLAILLYWKSKRSRRPVYAVRNTNLFRDRAQQLEALSISYHGSKVENLSIARVALWNAGSETIDRTDIAPSDKIRMVGQENVSFLEAEILYEKNPANNITLTPLVDSQNPTKHIQNALEIEFDYLDRNEGVVLQVFHTGRSANSIRIEGTVKGGGMVRRLQDTSILSQVSSPIAFVRKLKWRHRRIIAGALLIVVPIVGIAVELLPQQARDNEHIVRYVALAALTAIYWGAAYAILRRRTPRGFDALDEDVAV